MLFTSWLRSLKTGFVSTRLRAKARRRRMWRRSLSLAAAGIEKPEECVLLTAMPIFNPAAYTIDVSILSGIKNPSHFCVGPSLPEGGRMKLVDFSALVVNVCLPRLLLSAVPFR
ncbi:MAG: hypothetical protein KY476_14310 [Planctomycetes bacterium]|nr:hypothetical protein [Planctomycetota bacterium]